MKAKKKTQRFHQGRTADMSNLRILSTSGETCNWPTGKKSEHQASSSETESGQSFTLPQSHGTLAPSSTTPSPNPLILGNPGSSLLIGQHAAFLHLAQLKAQAVALTQINNAISVGCQAANLTSITNISTPYGASKPPSPTAAAISLLNRLKIANTMAQPLHKLLLLGHQNSSQGQHGFSSGVPDVGPGSATPCLRSACGYSPSAGPFATLATGNSGRIIPPLMGHTGVSRPEQSGAISHQGMSVLKYQPQGQNTCPAGSLGGLAETTCPESLTSVSSGLRYPDVESSRSSLVGLPKYERSRDDDSERNSSSVSWSHTRNDEKKDNVGTGDGESPVPGEPRSLTETSYPTFTPEDAVRILSHFGLEKEDLGFLVSYPEDQLTPANLPFILRHIQMQKRKTLSTTVSGTRATMAVSQPPEANDHGPTRVEDETTKSSNSDGNGRRLFDTYKNHSSQGSEELLKNIGSSHDQSNTIENTVCSLRPNSAILPINDEAWRLEVQPNQTFVTGSTPWIVPPKEVTGGVLMAEDSSTYHQYTSRQSSGASLNKDPFGPSNISPFTVPNNEKGTFHVIPVNEKLPSLNRENADQHLKWKHQSSLPLRHCEHHGQGKNQYKGSMLPPMQIRNHQIQQHQIQEPAKKNAAVKMGKALRIPVVAEKLPPPLAPITKTPVPKVQCSVGEPGSASFRPAQSRSGQNVHKWSYDSKESIVGLHCNRITPSVFPHTCSLCYIKCRTLKEWFDHQKTILHVKRQFQIQSGSSSTRSKSLNRYSRGREKRNVEETQYAMRRTFERGSSPRRNNGRWSSPSFQTPKRRVGRGTSTFNQLQTRNINRRFSPVPHLPRWRRMDGQSSSSYERWSSVKSHGRLSSCNRSNERRSSPRSCHRQHSPETTHKRKRSSSTEKVLKEILDDPASFRESNMDTVVKTIVAALGNNKSSLPPPSEDEVSKPSHSTNSSLSVEAMEKEKKEKKETTTSYIMFNQPQTEDMGLENLVNVKTLDNVDILDHHFWVPEEIVREEPRKEAEPSKVNAERKEPVELVGTEPCGTQPMEGECSIEGKGKKLTNTKEEAETNNSQALNEKHQTRQDVCTPEHPNVPPHKEEAAPESADADKNTFVKVSSEQQELELTVPALETKTDGLKTSTTTGECSSELGANFSLKILERHLGEVTMRPDPDTLHTEGNPSTDPSRSQHSDHLFQSNKQTVSSASTQCGKLEDSVSAASSPKVLSTSLVSSLENQKAPLIMDKDTFLAIKAAIFQYRLNKADRKTKGHGVFSGNNPFKKLDVEEVGTEKETQRSIESHDTKPTTSLTDSEVFVSSFPSNFSKPTEEPLKRTSTTGPPRLRLSDSFETGQSQLLDKVVTSNSCLNLYFEKHPEISSQEGDHVIKHQPITDQNHGSTVKQQCKDVDVQQTPIDVCAVKDTGNKEVHEVDCLQLVSRNTRNEVRTIEDRSEGFRGRGTKLEPYKTFRNIRKQWDQIQKDKDSFKISDSVQVTDADDQTVMSKERTNLIDNKDSFGKIFNCDIRHPPKKKYKSSETQGRTLKTGESPGETVEVSQESQKNKETCEELSCQIMDSGEEEKVQSTSERFVSEEGKTKKPIERLGGDNKASSEVDVSVRGVNENIISTDYQSTVERKEGPKQQCTKLKKDGQDSPEIELDGNEMSSYFPDSLGNKGTIDYQLREDDTGILKENTCFNHFVEYLEEQQDEDQEAPLRAHVFSRETNETSQEDWNLMTLSEREKTSVSTGVNHKGVKGADIFMKRRTEAVGPQTKRSFLDTCMNMPPFNPSMRLGQEFIVPKCGYVCNLCCVFYLDEKRAKDLHCSGLRHHDNLQKYYQNNVCAEHQDTHLHTLQNSTTDLPF